MTHTSTSDLLTRAQRGDPGALGEIVRVHQRAAIRLAVVVGGDASEAEDIVQEAFVRALRSLHAVRSPDALRSWLLRAVANQAKNARRGRWRRDRRYARVAAMHRDQGADATETAVMVELDNQRLRGALATLSVDDRTVLGCRYLAGLTERETAEVAGIAVGTVKSRTSRALDRLRAAMSAGEQEGTP